MGISFFLTSEKIFLYFNFDLLETNTINILLLLGLLVYVKISALDPSLEARQKEIIQSVESVEKDFFKAANYYYLRQKSVRENFFCLQSWKNFSNQEKIFFIKSKYEFAKKNLEESFSTTKLLIKNIENKIYLTLQKQILFIVASQILRNFFLLSKKNKSKLVEKAIEKFREVK